MLYSIIDIGSNTVKLAVLDGEKIFSPVPVFFKATAMGLRSKVENGSLKESAIEELCALIAEYLKTARRLTDTTPIAFATASIRGLGNTEEILNRIWQETGLTVELISGETEALYSFLGARGSLPVKAGISVDLGGGSTEIVSFRKNQVIDSVSLPFGCLTLYMKFFDGDRFEYDACCAYIREHLKKSAPKMPGKSILVSGGSSKAILKYKNILENKKTHSIGTAQFRRILRHYRYGDEKSRAKLEIVLKDRYRLVPAALAVFSQIASFYGRDQVLVCRHGVREGCLYHHLQKK
ncbi:MAG: hypothetical protein IKJ74_00405 [Clostridia bacterium]|nr:hypothetical protein [Clostridia bacterium]